MKTSLISESCFKEFHFGTIVNVPLMKSEEIVILKLDTKSKSNKEKSGIPAKKQKMMLAFG